MKIFVYSDESGVFDYVHNDWFVFGGVLFLSEKERDDVLHKYHAVEKTIRTNGGYGPNVELKASVITKKQRGSIMRSLNNEIKFASVIRQKRVEKNIFSHKKHKQRFLDYAFKMGLKNCLMEMSQEGRIDLSKIVQMSVCCDEHTTATSGEYELEESLLKEFKIGMHSKDFRRFFPPCIPTLQTLTVKFCASETSALVRAGDVIANHVFGCASNNKPCQKPNIYIKYLP